MEEQITVKWVGPTGDNPRVGDVITGEDKTMSVENADYFKSLKLVKDLKKKEPKRTGGH